MLELVKRIFCNHTQLEFMRNIYCDDEFWLGRMFRCINCGKLLYKDTSNQLMEAPLNFINHK